MTPEVLEVQDIFDHTEPEQRTRMLVLLMDYAKSDAVTEWAREKYAETDPEYRLRKSLRPFLVETLPTQP